MSVLLGEMMVRTRVARSGRLDRKRRLTIAAFWRGVGWQSPEMLEAVMARRRLRSAGLNGTSGFGDYRRRPRTSGFRSMITILESLLQYRVDSLSYPYNNIHESKEVREW
jgi:hypothetical protein